MKTFLGAILFLYGCAGITVEEPTYTKVPAAQNTIRIIPVEVDITFSDKEKMELTKAIETWNYVLNNNIEFKIEHYDFNMEPARISNIQNNNGLMLLKINSTSPLVANINDHCLAIADGKNSIYFIMDRIGERTKHIGLHEIGHYLGAEHKETGLMRERYYSQDRCADIDVVKEIAEKNALDWRTMNYCK